MKKNIIFALLTITSTILFGYVDDDMDGVDNSIDRCPNTLFSDLVDISGCSIGSLISPHGYDVIIGASYADSDYQTLNKTDTLATSLQVDYYYKNFSIQASTSYFTANGDDYSDSGLYDSFVGVAYRIQATESLLLSVGGGAILPTYDTDLNNNKTDYTASLNASYSLDRINIFGAYSYGFINDDDVEGIVEYQNTNSFSGGMGYYVGEASYLSLSYNTSDSIYSGLEDIQTVSAYGYQSWDENWFSTLSYTYGLSETASNNHVAIRLGYLF